MVQYFYLRDQLKKPHPMRDIYREWWRAFLKETCTSVTSGYLAVHRDRTFPSCVFRFGELLNPATREGSRCPVVDRRPPVADSPWSGGRVLRRTADPTSDNSEPHVGREKHATPPIIKLRHTS
ncbi:hypothetical protein CBL_20128 [Carabus blaptoides fortunei]